jgi:hypothetical protein
MSRLPVNDGKSYTIQPKELAQKSGTELVDGTLLANWILSIQARKARQLLNELCDVLS